MPWLVIFLWLLLGAAFHATGATITSTDDTATTDIITPLALNVPDPGATAALRSAKALEIPALFLRLTNAPHIAADRLQTAFAAAHSNFLAQIAGEFHSEKLPDATIASADFGYLITAFNVRNKRFPITGPLAAEWARGGDGNGILETLLSLIQQTARQPICPDHLPEKFALGKMVRLLPVSDTNQTLSPQDAQKGTLIPSKNLLTLSTVRAQLRSQFSTEQQLFARALSAFLEPNCLPDPPLTQAIRAKAVEQIVVTRHLSAGDIIVHRGDPMDARARAALEALRKKLATEPPPTPVAPIKHSQPIEFASTKTVPQGSTPQPTRPASNRRLPHFWLILALAGISATSLLTAGWQFSRRRQSAKSVRSRTSPSSSTRHSLSPQVAKAVREAVVQELAQQRHELLLAQQVAADEITKLVHRFDELQLPLRERLQAYETRIQTLEQELGRRTEENRELLKIKIEMMRRQLENERAGNLDALN